MTAPPNLRWMLAHPARVIALGAGAGLPRIAPGTWGTLLGWGLFVLLDPIVSTFMWGVLIAIAFFVGAWAAQLTGQSLGQPDSGHIVIDEIVAIWLVLWCLPSGVEQPLLWQAGAFAVFRFFDITKPPPIRALDARLKHGWGVMIDDVLAAFYTVALFAAGVSAYRYFSG